MRVAVPSIRPSGVVGPWAAYTLLGLLLVVTPVASGQIVATAPNIDALKRFEEANGLVAQERTAEAIRIFEALTRSYPDWPEPHNNLAVLYAADGDYAMARNALVQAIDNHPSYATAHENLGDIYARMAGIAYGKALEIDGENQTARVKLAMVRELFSERGPAANSAIGEQ